MILYLDMDDVVADWQGRAQSLVNRSWSYGEVIPTADWNLISNDARFYRNLEVLAGAEALVARCREALATGEITDLRFLTALPGNHVPWAVWDKVMWAQRHFPGIPVMIGPYSYNKWQHCAPGDILIDDRESNCAQWQAVGGVSHVYQGWSTCEPWLESVLTNSGKNLTARV